MKLCNSRSMYGVIPKLRLAKFGIFDPLPPSSRYHHASSDPLPPSSRVTEVRRFFGEYFCVIIIIEMLYYAVLLFNSAKYLCVIAVFN